MSEKLTKQQMIDAILETVEGMELRDCIKLIQENMEARLKKLKKKALEREYRAVVNPTGVN